jgi:hypothetical protein
MLDLLQTHGLSHAAEAVAESLAPFAAAGAYGAHFADGRKGGWIDDAYWWRAARRVLADELIRKIESTAGVRQADPTETVRWREFMAETRKVDVKIDGLRVRAAGRRPQDGAVIEAQLTMTNHTRTPVVGTLAFGELPIGWKAEPPQVEVPRIDPGGAARATLTARAPVLTWNSDGVRYLPIRFEANRRTVNLAARLAYVPAPLLPRPIAVDGDLSDWPATPGNAAADFVLVTGEPAGAGTTHAARPTAATRCLVARDGEYLYFGFSCPAASAADLQTRGNTVTYEDMIPVGEDLVEILIDPDMTGTHSTGDLYHIAVKLSGAMWEHGIGLDPPTGSRSVWAADIRHAARWHGDRWEAEVRVPLSAFPPQPGPARDHRFWGVNFTRFDVVHQEYANWSGAVSNVYDPMSLGNLGL